MGREDKMARKKKITMSEAKKNGNSGIRVKIILNADAQALFRKHPDRRVTFSMLVAFAAKKANAGSWKGNIGKNGKFDVTVTGPRMRGLLEEASEHVRNRPITQRGAEQRFKGIQEHIRYLIREYGANVNFEEATTLFDKARDKFDELVHQNGEEYAVDFRGVVDEAQEASDTARNLVLQGYKLRLKEMMERRGRGGLYPIVIGRLPSDPLSQLRELRHLIWLCNRRGAPRTQKSAHTLFGRGEGPCKRTLPSAA
jgi:hypothetical protein